MNVFPSYFQILYIRLQRKFSENLLNFPWKILKARLEARTVTSPGTLAYDCEMNPDLLPHK